MPRNGSGTYSRAISPYVNGATATATDVNTEMDDIATALTGSLPVAGTKAMAANLPMGGYKVTGLAAGASNGDAIRYEQLTALSGVYQPLDADLTALAGLTSAADKIPYFTGSAAASLIDIGTSGAVLGKLNAALTFSGVCTYTGNGGAGVILSGAAPYLTLSETNTSKAAYIVLDSSALSFRYNSLSDFSLRITAAGTVDIAGDVVATLTASQTLTNKTISGISSLRIKPLTTTTGSLVVGDANCGGTLTGGVTLPNSVFSANDAIVFEAGASNRTITRGSGIAMHLNGTDVASATLPANTVGGVFWRSASVAILSGAFI